MMGKPRSPRKAKKLKSKTTQEISHPDEVILADKYSHSDIIRSEVNFLVFPFFSLSRQDTYKRTKTEYQAVVTRDYERLEVSWKVTANSEHGYPGPFDRQLHKAIEQILSEKKPPFSNPVKLGSLAHLGKRIGIHHCGGNRYNQIKDALERITATTVKSVGTFYSKEKKRFIEDVFHLYDRVVFIGQELPNGEVADTNYLFLNSWYLENLNCRYVRPLDYSYLKSLKSPIASRLYELLGVKFYGLGSQLHVRYKYSTLCQLLPVTRQQYLSDVKYILNPAHRELIQTEFLKTVEWSPLPDNKKDWYITYYPGRRAKEEIQRFQPQIEPPVETDTSQDVQPQLPEAELSLSQPQLELVKEMEDFGMTKMVAENLARHSDLEKVKSWMKVVSQNSDIQDKPAYLVKAIRENWQLPEGFLKEEEVRKEKEQRREILRKMEAKQAKKRKTKLISSSSEYAEIWQKVQSLLKQQVSPTNFETWVKETTLLGIEEGIAFIGVPSEFVKDWLSKIMKTLMQKNLIQILGKEVDLEFVAKKEKAKSSTL